MVDKSEVYSVADRMAARGEKPTARAVRARLRRGGSFSDIGPLLAQWKSERNWRPRVPLPAMPKALQDCFAEFASSIWKAAQDEAAALASDREVRLEELRRDILADAASAGAERDATEALAGVLRATIADLRAEILDLQAERARLLTRLERIERLGVRTLRKGLADAKAD